MRKTLICCLLCMAALVSLSFGGCGKDTDSTPQEEASVRPAVTLNMWLISEKEISAETEALVEEAFNELTQSKYTTKVDFVFLTADEYFEVLDAKLSAAAEAKLNDDSVVLLPGLGEETTEVVETTAETFVNELGQRLLKYPDVEENQIDIIFLAGEELFKRYVNDSKLSSMDTNLNSTSKVLKDYIYPSFLEQIKHEKSTYAIPNNHLIGEYTYLLVNKSLAEKYYFDISKLNTFAACKDLINEIGTNEQGIAPVLAYAEPTNMKYWVGDGMSMIASYVPTQATVGTRTSMRSLVDISNFTDHMVLMQTCKDNGWFAADPTATQEFGVAIMKGGYEIVSQYSDKYDVKVLSYPTLTEETVYESMFAVSVYTADFNRAMEIITLINTDVTAKNILQYGVEGVHFVLDEEDGSFSSLNDDYVMNNLYTGNTFLAYPTEDMPADIWENAKIANRDSVISPYYGLKEDWALISPSFLETLRGISDQYIARMNACTNATELADFFVAAKAELIANGQFSAAFGTDAESMSPNAVYSRWIERVHPSAE